MIGALGYTGAFGFYAGQNVIAFIMIFFLLPKTKQLTLEELDFVFGVPTKKHASYQLNTRLPWWFEKWVMRRANEPIGPLYHLDKINGIERHPDYVTAGARALQ